METESDKLNSEATLPTVFLQYVDKFDVSQKVPNQPLLGQAS